MTRRGLSAGVTVWIRAVFHDDRPARVLYRGIWTGAGNKWRFEGPALAISVGSKQPSHGRVEVLDFVSHLTKTYQMKSLTTIRLSAFAISAKNDAARSAEGPRPRNAAFKMESDEPEDDSFGGLLRMYRR